jgi:hypothetical protein
MALGFLVMTSIQFLGPRAKLRAVRRHGKAFREELNRYIATNKDALKFRVVPPFTGYTGFASFSPMPEDLSVIAGEIANQLRSSLDLLACDLAKRSGATNINDVYFPIARTKEGYFDKRSRNKIAKLTPELRQAIDDLQPYDDSILVKLNALAGADKHRHLLSAIPSIEKTSWAAYGNKDFERLELDVRKPGILESGEIPLLRIPGNSPIDLLHLKLHCRVVFNVEPVIGKPVTETLTDMGRAVEGIIGQFEALCAGP